MGKNLATFLNSKIDDDKRSEAISRIASAASISESTVNQILNGSIACPPLNRLRGLARGTSSTLSEVQRAAEKDGCNYRSLKAYKKNVTEWHNHVTRKTKHRQ